MKSKRKFENSFMATKTSRPKIDKKSSKINEIFLILLQKIFKTAAKYCKVFLKLLQNAVNKQISSSCVPNTINLTFSASIQPRTGLFKFLKNKEEAKLTAHEQQSKKNPACIRAWIESAEPHEKFFWIFTKSYRSPGPCGGLSLCSPIWNRM